MCDGVQGAENGQPVAKVGDGQAKVELPSHAERQSVPHPPLTCCRRKSIPFTVCFRAVQAARQSSLACQQNDGVSCLLGFTVWLLAWEPIPPGKQSVPRM